MLHPHLRDELPDLVRDPRTRSLAAASVTLEEFLASLPDWKPGRLDARAVVHGHCHQKALVGMDPTRQVLSRVEGLEFEILDSGCCGMAGSFGYEEGHYDVSKACGERVLFPAACRSLPVVVPPGGERRDTIQVLSAPGMYPEFRVDEIDGTYRLVWHGVFHRGEPPVGTPLPQEERTSNEFTLSAPQQ